MLRDSVVVVRTRPRAIPIAMITMTKSLMGFLFFPVMTVFTLETHQMFSVHTTPEKFEKATIIILFLCLRKIRAEKSRDYFDAIVFEKLRF